MGQYRVILQKQYPVNYCVQVKKKFLCFEYWEDIAHFFVMFRGFEQTKKVAESFMRGIIKAEAEMEQK